VKERIIMPITLLEVRTGIAREGRIVTFKESFRCLKCKKQTFSVDNADSILREGISNPELVNLIKKLMAESRMKEYLFWRCKRCNVYYQTELSGKFLKRFPLRER